MDLPHLPRNANLCPLTKREEFILFLSPLGLGVLFFYVPPNLIGTGMLVLPPPWESFSIYKALQHPLSCLILTATSRDMHAKFFFFFFLNTDEKTVRPKKARGQGHSWELGFPAPNPSSISVSNSPKWSSLILDLTVPWPLRQPTQESFTSARVCILQEASLVYLAENSVQY